MFEFCVSIKYCTIEIKLEMKCQIKNSGRWNVKYKILGDEMSNKKFREMKCQIKIQGDENVN